MPAIKKILPKTKKGKLILVTAITPTSSEKEKQQQV
jgi:formyltetrahydrofolate synthetase